MNLFIDAAVLSTSHHDTKGSGSIPHPSEWNRWSMGAALKLDTDAAPYEWLNTVQAFWVGEFNMIAGQQRGNNISNLKFSTTL